MGVILWAGLFGTVSLRAASGTDTLRSAALKGLSSRQTTYGFKIDNSAARYWDEFILVRNANAGDPVAEHELGLRYLTHDGFPADEHAVPANGVPDTVHEQRSGLVRCRLAAGWEPHDARARWITVG